MSFTIKPNSWLNELPDYQRKTLMEILASGHSYEQAAEIWLSTIGSQSNAPFGSISTGPGIFQALKIEIKKLVCGDDSYNDLREKIDVTWSNYKPGILAAICMVIAPVIGVSSVIILPAVAMLLEAILKVGVNSWCSLPDGN